MTLHAAATALFGWLGAPIAWFILLVWWQVFTIARRESQNALAPREPLPCSEQRPAFAKPELVVCLLVIGMLVGLLMPATSDTDSMRHAEISMKMVAHALSEYEQEHGRLPPIVTRDEHGQALHSWRALLLPYLDEPQLQAAYRYNEPWNSPHNVALAQYRPWHFRGYYPNDEIAAECTAMQALPVGDRYVLCEHEDFVSNWLEPMQLDADAIDAFANAADARQGFWHHGIFSSQYRGRLMVSGAVSYQVYPSSSSAIVTAMADPQVGMHARKIVGRPWRVWHTRNAVLLAVFVAVTLYPFRWLHRITRGGLEAKRSGG
ncbi:MAG: DUF1559 domain-containing protein [Pirellulaceae bacterium]